MGSLKTHEERIAELEPERQRLQQTLAVIRERIAKADEKYRADRSVGSYHKWSSILSGLEEELDRTRALLVACEAELGERTRKLADQHERRTDAKTAPATPAEEAPSPEIEPDQPLRVKTPPNAKMEEIAENVDPAEAPQPNVQTALLDAEEPASAKEEPAEEIDPAEAEEQRAVEAILEQVGRGQVSQLTLGQFEQLLARYVAVLHRLDPSEEEVAFEETLAAGIQKVDRELQRLHKKWIPYAPVE